MLTIAVETVYEEFYNRF